MVTTIKKPRYILKIQPMEQGVKFEAIDTLAPAGFRIMHAGRLASIDDVLAIFRLRLKIEIGSATPSTRESTEPQPSASNQTKEGSH